LRTTRLVIVGIVTLGMITALGGGIVLDAAGLSLLTVTGAGKALQLGLGPAQAVILGAITAAGGGALRDIMIRQIPIVLRSELHAIPALIGAAAIVVFTLLGLYGLVPAGQGGRSVLRDPQGWGPLQPQRADAPALPREPRPAAAQPRPGTPLACRGRRRASPVPGCRRRRSQWPRSRTATGRLPHRKRVHVHAEQHRRAVSIAQDAHHAGAADLLVHVEPGAAEPGGDQARGPRLLVRQLRVPVDVPAPLLLPWPRLLQAGENG
jgi:hypothetical protein